jgi:hypothetical protein
MELTMRRNCALALAGLFSLFICRYAEAQKMLVRAGVTFSQVNDHPLSYTTPGRANTNCSNTGTVNGTATDNGHGRTEVSGAANTSTNCTSTYTPPQTTTGNWTTVDNAAWVMNLANGDYYLIQCTAHWRGSKCANLIGGTYRAELEGTDMVVNEIQGRKEVKVKYHVIRFVPGSPRPTSESSPSSLADKPAWVAGETYVWTIYKNLPREDKDYVQVFCPENPKGVALVPQVKVKAGQGAEHAIDCVNWLSAKQKTE